jgi:2-C-methyl-D-erythritol 2,4-cyclodiphosphate synthase
LGEWKINHIAIAIECQVPKMFPQIDAMKENIAQICKINISDIGITATTGEDLTAFGRGEGIQVITIITVIKS